jgi:putative transposase
MGRAPRTTVPGLAYHVLNRRVMRLPLFRKAGDFEAFERVLAEALARPDAPRLLTYCLMTNHWHLGVLAGAGTNLSTWMQWLTVTHTHRWNGHRRCVGQGPLYQGRFKSFPVESDSHLLLLCRYIEANPRRAGMVERAEQWRWSSLGVREHGSAQRRALLSDWPVDRPRNWLAQVNRSWAEPELARLRQSVAKGTPLGSPGWVEAIAANLGLATTLRPRGRPRKETKST